jgi:hypothetical protein
MRLFGSDVVCLLGIDVMRLCRSLCCTGADLDEVKDALYWWNPTKKATAPPLPALCHRAISTRAPPQ